MSLLPAPQFSYKHKKSKSTSFVVSSLKLKSHRPGTKSIYGGSSTNKPNTATNAMASTKPTTCGSSRVNSIGSTSTKMLPSRHKSLSAMQATTVAVLPTTMKAPTAPKPIYTYAEDSLSPTAIYNRNKKNRIYQTPSTQTLGLPNQQTYTASSSSIHTKVSNQSSFAVSHHLNSPTKSEISNKSREYGLKAAQSAASLSLNNPCPTALHLSASAKRNSMLSSFSIPSSINSSVAAESTHYLQNIDKVETVARHTVEKKVSKIQYRQSLPSGSRSQLDSTQIIALAQKNSVNTISKIDNNSHYLDPLIASNHAFAKRALNNINSIPAIVFPHAPDFSQDPHYQNALQVARENSLQRQSKLGKVDIGGGKFMTQNEIDTIAEKHVRPVLNEISYKAQEQRLKDKELFPFGLSKDCEGSRVKRFVKKLNFFKKKQHQNKPVAGASELDATVTGLDAAVTGLDGTSNENQNTKYVRNSFSTSSRRINYEDSFDSSNIKSNRQRQSFDTSLLNETVSTIGSSRIHTERPFDINSQLDNTIKNHDITFKKTENDLII